MKECIDTLKRENPWSDLLQKIIEEKYNPLSSNSIDSDKEIIDNFNKDYETKNEGIYKLYTSMLPSHYTGNILNSSIVLLASNPGYNIEEEKNLYVNPDFIKETVQHLSFNRKELLSRDPERIKESSYWHDKLDMLIKETSFDIVSNNISKIQFNPYHTIKFKNIPKKYFNDKSKNCYLDSQKYGFRLLNYCISEGKIIIVLRSKKIWFEAVPALNDHLRNGNVFEIKNYRQPYLTKNNFTNKDDFYTIIDYLKNNL
jgi:hypothetical protein